MARANRTQKCPPAASCSSSKVKPQLVMQPGGHGSGFLLHDYSYVYDAAKKIACAAELSQLSALAVRL